MVSARRVLAVCVIFLVLVPLGGVAADEARPSARELILNPGPQTLRLAWEEPLDFEVSLEGTLTVIAPQGLPTGVPPELAEGARVALSAVVTLKPKPCEEKDLACVSAILQSVKLKARALGHELNVAGDTEHILATVDKKVLFDSKRGALAALPIGKMFFGQEAVVLRISPRGRLANLAAAGILALLSGEGQDPFAGINKLLESLPELFPQDPVKLFQGWRVSWPLEEPELGLRASTDMIFRLQSFAIVDGRLCAKVTGRVQLCLNEFNLSQLVQQIPVVGTAKNDEQKPLPAVVFSGHLLVLGSVLLDVQTKELVGAELKLELQAAQGPEEEGKAAGAALRGDLRLSLVRKRAD